MAKTTKARRGTDRTPKESQWPLAIAGIGVAIADALLERDPTLHDALKRKAIKWAQFMDDRGEGWELVADSLKAFSRALHDHQLFPLPMERQEEPPKKDSPTS